MAGLTLSFPLTNKEEKHIEKCKEFVGKGGDIEKHKELLNCLAPTIGIEKERVGELIKDIKEKYQRKQQFLSDSAWWNRAIAQHEGRTGKEELRNVLRNPTL